VRSARQPEEKRVLAVLEKGKKTGGGKSEKKKASSCTGRDRQKVHSRERASTPTTPPKEEQDVSTAGTGRKQGELCLGERKGSSRPLCEKRKRTDEKKKGNLAPHLEKRGELTGPVGGEAVFAIKTTEEEVRKSHKRKPLSPFDITGKQTRKPSSRREKNDLDARKGNRCPALVRGGNRKKWKGSHPGEALEEEIFS